MSNPTTPKDKYGRKVRDKGMEALEKRVVKEPNSILWYNTQEPTPSTTTSRAPLSQREQEQQPLTPRGRRKRFLKEHSLSSLLEVEEIKSNKRSSDTESSSTTPIKTLREETVKEQPEPSRSDRLSVHNKTSGGRSSDDATPERSRRYSSDASNSERSRNKYGSTSDYDGKTDCSRSTTDDRRDFYRRSDSKNKYLDVDTPERNRKNNKNDTSASSADRSRKYSSDDILSTTSTSSAKSKTKNSTEDRRRRFKEDLEELDRKYIDETLEQNRKYIESLKNRKYQEAGIEKRRALSLMLSDDDDDDYMERRKRDSEKTHDIDRDSVHERNTKMWEKEQGREIGADIPITKDDKKDELTSTRNKKEKESKSPKPRKSPSGRDNNEDKSPKHSHHKTTSLSNETEVGHDEEDDDGSSSKIEKKQPQSRTHKLFDSFRHSTIRRNKSRGKHDTTKADKQAAKDAAKNNNNSKSKEGLLLLFK